MPPKNRRQQNTRKRLLSLLNKEARLSASPLSYLFLLFPALTLLDGVPVLLWTLFLCLGMFYSFHAMGENHDLLYMVLLPLPKRDAVTGKFLFCCCLEAAGFALTAVFAGLRMAGAGQDRGLMPPNLIFLGCVLLVFAAFNRLFLGRFFETGGKLGKPFLGFLGVAVALMALGEALQRIPALAILRATGGRELLYQCPFPLLCAACWAYVTLRAWRRAQTVFVKADL